MKPGVEVARYVEDLFDDEATPNVGASVFETAKGTLLPDASEPGS